MLHSFVPVVLSYYCWSLHARRTIAVFQREPSLDGAADGQPIAPFRLLGKIKAHARIVWGVSWAPDSRTFASGSRDNAVKIWAVGGEGPFQASNALVVKDIWCNQLNIHRC